MGKRLCAVCNGKDIKKAGLCNMQGPTLFHRGRKPFCFFKIMRFHRYIKNQQQPISVLLDVKSRNLFTGLKISLPERDITLPKERFVVKRVPFYNA